MKVTSNWVWSYAWELNFDDYGGALAYIQGFVPVHVQIEDELVHSSLRGLSSYYYLIEKKVIHIRKLNVS